MEYLSVAVAAWIQALFLSSEYNCRSHQGGDGGGRGLEYLEPYKMSTKFVKNKEMNKTTKLKNM